MTDTLRVHLDELDFDAEQVMHWEGKPFTGIGVEFFPDGTLRSEVYHVDGVEHGPSREWYSSGQIKEEVNLWYGGIHGYKRVWDEKGRLLSEEIGELGIGIAEKRWDAEPSPHFLAKIFSDSRWLQRAASRARPSHGVAPRAAPSGAQ